MAFAVPRNVPSFSNPQRLAEDHLWTSASGSASSRRTRNSGPTGMVDGFFDEKRRNTLPMYKDKPFAYPSSQRARPFWRRKRTLGGLLALVLCVFYLAGAFSKKAQMQSRDRWSWLNAASEPKGKADWSKRRERVVEAFELSWDAYSRYAWGYDEYAPIAKTGRKMSPTGLGWIIVDSLDTMMLMNLTSRLTHAREWISTSLNWEQDQDVNTFETTIRMLGGLLAAHYISTEFPQLAPIAEDDPGSPGEDLYLEKARDLADRLSSAFDSPSGIPYASVHLKNLQGIPSHGDMGASSTAEATSVQLEFKYLAKLTGEKDFWDRVEKVMQVVDDNGAQDGLLPIFIHPSTGVFRGSNIRLGSRGDSYYEYLIKQYLQTEKQEPVYKEMWTEAMAGVRKHLITYTPSGFTIVGERPDGLKQRLSPKMDHLVCFLPGTIALAATGGLTEAEARKSSTWSAQNEADMRLARELMHTCYATYKVMATGLAAEIMHFDIADPPPAESAAHRPAPDIEGPVGPYVRPGAGNEDDASASASAAASSKWKADFIVKPADVHNLQRPETIESLFYMWRITGDVRYREWGWEIFKAFMAHAAVAEGGGFTSLKNANVVPPIPMDNLESFWLAETLKYLYLLFSPDDILPLDKVVFNTEGHPFPRFSMGKLFKTGWARKPRDGNGKIMLSEADKAASAAAAEQKGNKKDK